MEKSVIMNLRLMRLMFSGGIVGLAVAGWAGVDTSQGMGMTLACIGGAVAAFAAIKLTAR